MFITEIFENPIRTICWLAIIIFSVCFHELMHAVTAKWQGDTTAADAGHITLNPLKQMGVFSIIMLLVIGIAWGSVPVNPARMRHKYSDALVSFAGPFANLILCVISILVCAIVDNFVSDVAIEGRLTMFFGIAAILNLVLFTFNMFPIPTFDGWHVFCHFFPRLEHAVSSSEFHKGATLILMIILFTSFGKIFEYAAIIISHAVNLVSNLISMIA